jgi:hypothetical protein
MIGNKPPKHYLEEIKEKIKDNDYNTFKSEELLLQNLKMNCVPEDIFEMEFNDYEDFLEKRRKLMARKIKDFYFSL